MTLTLAVFLGQGGSAHWAAGGGGEEPTLIVSVLGGLAAEVFETAGFTVLGKHNGNIVIMTECI